MNEQLHVKFEGDESQVKTLNIFHGNHLEPREPEKVNISGTISAPVEYLRKRVGVIDQLKSYVLVNRDELSIGLIFDETNFYKSTVIGKLQLSKEIKLFGINSGKEYSTFALADLIKMNRSHFESKEVAMKLVSNLREFKAKIDKDIELSKDDRANYAIKKVQSVESNIPKAFNLIIPLFKGMARVVIEVEIVIDPNSFDCQLIYPSANDNIEEFKNSAIDIQLDSIKDIAPQIAIIEV